MPTDAYQSESELVEAAPASNASAALTSLSTGDASNDYTEARRAAEEDGRRNPGDPSAPKSIRRRLSSGLRRLLRRSGSRGGATPRGNIGGTGAGSAEAGSTTPAAKSEVATQIAHHQVQAAAKLSDVA